MIPSSLYLKVVTSYWLFSAAGLIENRKMRKSNSLGKPKLPKRDRKEEEAFSFRQKANKRGDEKTNNKIKKNWSRK